MVEDWRARLRLAVERSGATHAAIARRAQIAPETLSRILNDAHAKPQFETIARIASATNVRVGWLVGEHVRGIELSAKDRETIRAAGAILLDALKREVLGAGKRPTMSHHVPVTNEDRN